MSREFDEIIKYHGMGKGWKLLTTSTEKASNNSTIRSVGMLLSPIAQRSLLAIRSISAWIMLATFHGNAILTIISCYSPTNAADDDTDAEFYSKLLSPIRRIPKHKMNIIACDLNVKIGSDKYKGCFLHEMTDRNGELLLLGVINEGKLLDVNNHLKKKVASYEPLHTQMGEGHS